MSIATGVSMGISFYCVFMVGTVENLPIHLPGKFTSNYQIRNTEEYIFLLPFERRQSLP